MTNLAEQGKRKSERQNQRLEEEGEPSILAKVHH